VNVFLFRDMFSSETYLQSYFLFRYIFSSEIYLRRYFLFGEFSSETFSLKRHILLREFSEETHSLQSQPRKSHMILGIVGLGSDIELLNCYFEIDSNLYNTNYFVSTLNNSRRPGWLRRDLKLGERRWDENRGRADLSPAQMAHLNSCPRKYCVIGQYQR
jgi:hypothetical protein